VQLFAGVRSLLQTISCLSTANTNATQRKLATLSHPRGVTDFCVIRSNITIHIPWSCLLRLLFFSMLAGAAPAFTSNLYHHRSSGWCSKTHNSPGHLGTGLHEVGVEEASKW